MACRSLEKCDKAAEDIRKFSRTQEHSANFGEVHCVDNITIKVIKSYEHRVIFSIFPNVLNLFIEKLKSTTNYRGMDSSSILY